jgi:uncharacterized lipoprotein NlpE involved in copper resistance
MKRVVIAAVAAAFALAGCNNGSTVALPPSPAVVAGEFSGPVTDSVAGTQTGDLVLAQHGSSLGGAMTLTTGTTTTTESVVLTLVGSSFTGTGASTVNGAACMTKITGSYANDAIVATYVGATGCTNTGSWNLTQTCAGTPEAVERQTAGLVPRC